MKRLYFTIECPLHGATRIPFRSPWGCRFVHPWWFPFVIRTVSSFRVEGPFH